MNASLENDGSHFFHNSSGTLSLLSNHTEMRHHEEKFSSVNTTWTNSTLTLTNWATDNSMHNSKHQSEIVFYNSFDETSSRELTLIKNHEDRSKSIKACATKVIGYYTSWGERNMTKRVLSYLTHVNYAFPDFSANGSIGFGNESAARLTRLLDLRGNESTPKISLSIGGWGSSETFTVLVRNETIMIKFFEGLLELLLQYNLDGVDIDWEYPGAEDKELYVVFLKRMRQELDSWKRVLQKDHLLLTFAGEFRKFRMIHRYRAISHRN